MTFARIAARAAISPSLISYHFRSKAELNRAIALAIEEHLEAFMAGASNGATSHLDAARRTVVAFVEYVDRYRVRMEALRQMDVALTPAERAGIGILDEESGVGRWQDLFTEGQRAGEFRDFGTRGVAVAVMGMLNAVPRELYRHPEADARRLGNELADLVCASIERTAGS